MKEMQMKPFVDSRYSIESCIVVVVSYISPLLLYSYRHNLFDLEKTKTKAQKVNKHF